LISAVNPRAQGSATNLGKGRTSGAKARMYFQRLNGTTEEVAEKLAALVEIPFTG
jgi:hypothetical protein